MTTDKKNTTVSILALVVAVISAIIPLYVFFSGNTAKALESKASVVDMKRLEVSISEKVDKTYVDSRFQDHKSLHDVQNQRLDEMYGWVKALYEKEMNR